MSRELQVKQTEVSLVRVGHNQPKRAMSWRERQVIESHSLAQISCHLIAPNLFDCVEMAAQATPEVAEGKRLGTWIPALG